jgi:hypothetical protein
MVRTNKKAPFRCFFVALRHFTVSFDCSYSHTLRRDLYPTFTGKWNSTAGEIYIVDSI